MARQKKGARPQQAAARATPAFVEAHGWTILAHPLFLDQVERLIKATERERTGTSGGPGPNEKLLAHLLDLVFEKIPSDPGGPQFRHGGTLGRSLKHWFRGKTGNGRYRLFYRYDSATRVILYAWVNDAESLRTYGSRTDAYAVFAGMLEAGNPPDSWDALVQAASSPGVREQLRKIRAHHKQ